MPVSFIQGVRGLFASVQGDLTSDDVRSLAHARVANVHLAMPVWTGQGLDCLAAAPGILRVHVVAYSPVDLSTLGDCASLIELSVFGVPSGTLDLARLPKLTALRVHLQSGGKFKLRNLGRAMRLEDIDGNLGAKQLEELGALSTLRRAFLAKSKIESLEFLRGNGSLVAVSLERCSELRDIEALSALEELEFVRVLGSRKIDRHESLASLPRLTTLALDDCGAMKSVEFLQGFELLASLSLSGDTCIDDGHLAFLQALPSLGFVNFVDRAHYDAKHADFPFDLRIPEERFGLYRPSVSGAL